ncbi:MAG: S9 family peptidase [Elusimicrobia bacterium]|nr:MAG: S9 family peptidase [Elusimicrobiota bacterium]
MTRIFLCLLFVAAPLQAQQADPFLWLEDVQGKKSLDWARARNKETLTRLQSDARYKKILQEAENILQATDRIPSISRKGNWLYNFWQDETHVRGIWRRTTLEEYRKKNPKWETMLDIDALGRVENKSWVYKGSSCLAPHYYRCMIKLSPGGSDASEWREFDTLKKAFVPNGFKLAEAKSNLEWLDENTLLVGTDFGPGSKTDSGYPRITKRWARGTALEKAKTIFEGSKKDVSVYPWVSRRPEGTTVLVGKSPSFFTNRYWLMSDDGERLSIPFPDEIRAYGIFKGKMLVTLRKAWKTFPNGALIAMDLSDVREGKAQPRVELVFQLDEDSGYPRRGAVGLAKDFVLLAIMKDVMTSLYAAKPGADGKWTVTPLPVPKSGTVSPHHVDSYSNDVFYSYDDFLTPSTLFLLPEGASKAETLKNMPARFDSSEFEVQQFFAVSRDSEHVPYFIVNKKGIPFDGKNPTLLYGYGGFEIPLKPRYLTTLGKLWLERGGVYVLSNIRGGGEYGPKWHQAALLENRQIAFNDFISIAEDLIEQKITSPRHLGIMGGSNGGLLMGAVTMQRPDLFNAVVCQVPLLDMMRYHKLLAGASWMGEYGNPDDPKMRKVIRKYSPYQNVLWYKERQYPEVLFMTSTKDDRVHPGHARKMVAKMKARNHQVWYYENIEGGHSAAADLRQKAKRKALETVYLLQYLKD